MESGKCGKTMKNRICAKILALCTMSLILFVLQACEDTEGYNFFSAIEGTVYDAASGKSLSNASVVLIPSSRTLQTNENGTFIFEKLDPGQYTLSVQKEGYYVDRKSVSAVSGETIRTDILLQKI